MSKTETFLSHNTALVQDPILFVHLLSQINWQGENAQQQHPLVKGGAVTGGRTTNILVTTSFFIIKDCETCSQFFIIPGNKKKAWVTVNGRAFFLVLLFLFY